MVVGEVTEGGQRTVEQERAVVADKSLRGAGRGASGSKERAEETLLVMALDSSPPSLRSASPGSRPE